MPMLDDRLIQRWGHSFEEDRDGVRVYRPVGYPFPLARGRDGIEFRPDGTYVYWAIGRGDATSPQPGSWHLDEQGRIHLTNAGREPRIAEVVELAPDRLELRIGGAS